MTAQKIPPAKVVSVLERARHVLGRVHQRSVPPVAAMMEMIIGAWRAQGIAVAADLKVADALADGPLTADELARRVGADPDALARLMRALIGEGVFTRRHDGRFALNALGDTLRSNAPNSMAGMARFVGHPAYREHWSGLLDAVKTGEAVPPKLRGMSGWEFMEQRPDLAAVFNDAMTSVSEMSVDPVVAAYDFAPYRTIIDVGGGHGRLLSAIIAATPGAIGVLYDLPQVVEGAPELLHKHGVADRVRAEGGSFLDRVPEGGDAYVMKNVIHDWADAEAVTILSNVRKAARAGSTLSAGRVRDPRPRPRVHRQVGRYGDAGAASRPRTHRRRLPKAVRAGRFSDDARGADRGPDKPG